MHKKKLQLCLFFLGFLSCNATPPPQNQAVKIYKTVVLQDPPGAPLSKYYHRTSWSPNGKLLCITDYASKLAFIYDAGTGALLNTIRVNASFADTLVARSREFNTPQFLSRAEAMKSTHLKIADLNTSLRGDIWNAQFLNDSVLIAAGLIEGVISQDSETLTRDNRAALFRYSLPSKSMSVMPLENGPDGTEPLGVEEMFNPSRTALFLAVWNIPARDRQQWGHATLLAEYGLDGTYHRTIMTYPKEFVATDHIYGAEVWPHGVCDSAGQLFVGFNVLENIYRPLQHSSFPLSQLGKTNQPYLDTLTWLHKKYGSIDSVEHLNMTTLWLKKPIFFNSLSMDEDGNIWASLTRRISNDPWSVEYFAQQYSPEGKLLGSWNVPWQSPAGEVTFSTYVPSEKALAIFRLSKTSGFKIEYAHCN